MKPIFTSVALGLSLLVASGGVGVADDYWKDDLRLAAQGDAFYQTKIGMLYFYGWGGVSQDYKEALKWFRLSSEKGNATAQYSMGTMYDRGWGVVKDQVYAHMWWNIAASNGHEDAVRFRDLIANEMTAADLSEAQALARACVAKNYKGC